jgi:hypothetical protein
MSKFSGCFLLVSAERTQRKLVDFVRSGFAFEFQIGLAKFDRDDGCDAFVDSGGQFLLKSCIDFAFIDGHCLVIPLPVSGGVHFVAQKIWPDPPVDTFGVRRQYKQAASNSVELLFY